MVVPLGSVAAPNDTAPEVVKRKYVYVWYFIILLEIAAVVGAILAKDLFMAFFYALLSGVVIYMVKNECENMTMYCLLMMGMLAGFQALFDLISLLMAVGGRKIATSTTRQGSDGTTTVTTTVKERPFFDNTAEFSYNASSAMMIASPSIMLILLLAAYYTYQAFPTSMFDDGDAESAPVSRDYGAGAYRAYGSQGAAAAPAPASRPPAQPQLFQGQGQRLGS